MSLNRCIIFTDVNLDPRYFGAVVACINNLTSAAGDGFDIDKYSDSMAAAILATSIVPKALKELLCCSNIAF